MTCHISTFLESLVGLDTEWKKSKDLVWQQELWWFVTIPWIAKIWWFEEVCDYIFPGWRHPHVCDGSPLVAYKQSPNQHEKEVTNANQVFFFISCKGLCTQFVWLDPEFQFTATTTMLMATKLSDLEDRTSGANLQMEGHMDVPSKSTKDPGEVGTLGSYPFHLPSWSLARRPLPSHPNTRHGLGIHMTLTNEWGAVTQQPHNWTVPLVEDMLHYARTGLTEAVITGPGRAILSYGRLSMGEGLSLGEARHAAFVLTVMGTWVGKPAYLAASPFTIQEGQWLNAQAVTECQTKLRGPGHLCMNPSTTLLFRFDHPGNSPQKDTPRDASSDH